MKTKKEIITGYEKTIQGLEKRIEEYREEIRRLQGQRTIWPPSAGEGDPRIN